MNTFVSCLLACAVIGVSLADIPAWDGLTIQYTANPAGYGTEGFITAPPTTADAIKGNWTVVPTTQRYPVTMRGKDGNPALGLLYSANGQFSGYVVNILASFYEGQALYKEGRYDITRWGFFEKTVINGLEYYSCTLYTVHPDTIIAGGRTGNNVGTGDGLWYQVAGGGLYNIPVDEKDLAAYEGGLWKKQNCFNGMGTHYSRNISKIMDCRDHVIPAPLTKDGGVVGIAFQLPGSSVGYGKPWFETVPAAVVKLIFPDAPQCLPDIVGNDGLISIHFWFKKTPQVTNICVASDSVKPYGKIGAPTY